MKTCVVTSTLGVTGCALSNWLLIEWTRGALRNAPQGLLPLPAFTGALFNLRHMLIVLVLIFVSVAVLHLRASKSSHRRAAFLFAGAWLIVLTITTLVPIACLLPWLSRVP
jgi:hypothetical protein